MDLAPSSFVAQSSWPGLSALLRHTWKFAALVLFGVSTNAYGQQYQDMNPGLITEAPQITAQSANYSLPQTADSDMQFYSGPGPDVSLGGSLQLTLEEAIGMALQSNTGMTLANLNIREKGFARNVARGNYYPNISATAGAFKFTDDLGETLQAGPVGPVPVNIIDRNLAWGGVLIGQPITQLLTIKQAVLLAEADRKIAQAQLRGGQRDLAFGVTQLFYGLLGAQQALSAAKLQAGATSASTDNGEARIAALQAQQAIMQAQGQVTQLQQQLASLLNVPIDTQLQLTEPPLPEKVATDVEYAVRMALDCSPEVQEARQNVHKACAGTRVARLAYVPEVTALGGYLNQDGIAVFDQRNIGFVGVTASMPLYQGGKLRGTVQQRSTQLAMAQHNLRAVEDKTRLGVEQVFRDYEGAWSGLQMAREIQQIRSDAVKQAGSQASDDVTAAEKSAQLDVMKAEVAYRLAHSKMMSVLEGLGAPQAAAGN